MHTCTHAHTHRHHHHQKPVTLPNIDTYQRNVAQPKKSHARTQKTPNISHTARKLKPYKCANTLAHPQWNFSQAPKQKTTVAKNKIKELKLFKTQESPQNTSHIKRKKDTETKTFFRGKDILSPDHLRENLSHRTNACHIRIQIVLLSTS